jgi:hypothetical protein
MWTPNSKMSQTSSNSIARIRWLVPLSLVLPVVALVGFHIVNWFHLDPSVRWEGSFIALPIRFLKRLGEFRISFPDGFLLWGFRTAVGIAPPWLLGWGLLSRVSRDGWVRGLAAFPVGLGLVGVALEALAMAGWLNTPLVWVVYLVAGGLGWALWRKESPSEVEPAAPCGSLFRLAAWSLFALITAFSFLHALFFPENYWDSLIYYLYYAKLIFLNGGIPFPVVRNGFPELVQCQVGLGLGANYAHLFLLWQAGVCKAFGQWSPFPGQWIAPLAGLSTALLVYRVAMVRWKSERMGLWAMLLVQSVPYWLWYQNWVSDYPLAVWLTLSAVALLAVGDGSLRMLAGVTALAIAGSHLNYLMVTLWWFVLVAWWGMGTQRWRPAAWAVLAVGVVLSSTWFIRNQVVTGNPVYAFFPKIFGGINIDPDVLKSCEVEWTANGDGMARLGPSLWSRIAGTPYFFLLDSNTHLKWATLPLGWFLPGLIVFLFRRRWGCFRAGILGYVLFLFFYEYVVSGLYLYHVMPLVPLMALVACEWMAFLDHGPRWVGGWHNAVILLMAATIGLPAALMGSKFSSPGLTHTLHPGMDPEFFLLQSIPEYEVWELINSRLPQSAVILTHENRHYYLRDDIKILHLDDYRLVPWYGRSEEQVENRLRELGVGYYLRISNERNHPILARLGVQKLLPKSFQLLYENGGTALYKIKD